MRSEPPVPLECLPNLAASCDGSGTHRALDGAWRCRGCFRCQPDGEDAWYRRYHALWCCYYAMTEKYDRDLPHVLVNGVAQVSPEFRGLSNKYALLLRRRLGLEAASRGREQPFASARRDASRLSFEAAQAAEATDEQLNEWLGPQPELTDRMFL